MNRFYPVETNIQFVLKGDKQGSHQKDRENTRPKGNAADMLPNFELSMPRVPIEEGAVLNISDTH